LGQIPLHAIIGSACSRSTDNAGTRAYSSSVTALAKYCFAATTSAEALDAGIVAFGTNPHTWNERERNPQIFGQTQAV
jgi:hypothetical protein